MAKRSAIAANSQAGYLDESARDKDAAWLKLLLKTINHLVPNWRRLIHTTIAADRLPAHQLAPLANKASNDLRRRRRRRRSVSVWRASKLKPPVSWSCSLPRNLRGGQEFWVKLVGQKRQFGHFNFIHILERRAQKLSHCSCLSKLAVINSIQ